MTRRTHVSLRTRQPHALDLEVALDGARLKGRPEVTALDRLVLRGPIPPTPSLDYVAGLFNPRRTKAELPAKLRVRTPSAANVPKLPKQQRFPVASIDLTRPDVALPFGVPPLVSVATLKGLAGGRATDQLLKNTPRGWEFIPDDAMVDLRDRSAEFRLGRLTIFS